MIYFAAGWFTPEQDKLYSKIVKILREEYGELEWFFPRDLGINLETKSPKEKKLLVKKVFALDTGMLLVTMKTDGFLLAIIDDYDTGMIWECGFAFGISFGKLPIITYTDKGYGLNVMLKESAIAHIKGIDQLRTFLSHYVDKGANMLALLEAAKHFQNFDEEVF